MKGLKTMSSDCDWMYLITTKNMLSYDCRRYQITKLLVAVTQAHLGLEIIDRHLKLWIWQYLFPLTIMISEICICLYGDGKEALHQGVSKCLWFWHFHLLKTKIFGILKHQFFSSTWFFSLQCGNIHPPVPKRINRHLGVKVVKE